MRIIQKEENISEKLSDISINLKEIGPYIKNMREQKEISLELLSEQLKISKEYLVAIEKGDEVYLPEMIYVKAMIRRISEKLNIDLRDFIKKEESNDNKELPINNQKLKNKSAKKAYLFIAIFSLIAIFLGISSTKIWLKIILRERQDYQQRYSPSMTNDLVK